MLRKMSSHPFCQTSEQQKPVTVTTQESQDESMQGVEGHVSPVGPSTFTFAYLHNTHDDDQSQGQELPSREDILNPGGPSDTGAVDPCEKH